MPVAETETLDQYQIKSISNSQPPMLPNARSIPISYCMRKDHFMLVEYGNLITFTDRKTLESSHFIKSHMRTYVFSFL